LVLIGDGPQRAPLEAHALMLEVEGRVWFAGARPAAAALLPALDVAVLPSLFEGMPLFVLEAMAAGRPVIGTAVCGTRELVRDGETGLLVPSTDPAALSIAANRLLDDPALAERMGAAGLARFQAEFRVEQMVERTVALYRDVWQRKRLQRLLTVRSQPGRRPASPARGAAPAQWLPDTPAQLSDFPAS
jgi:glycosyltransferase involved in cell wall biosynthesis